MIVFEKNRGYGAAIKEGFRRGRVPSWDSSTQMVRAIRSISPRCAAWPSRTRPDIVLGSRMGPASKMPRIRRIGNRIYAFLLGLLCGRSVTDTASGMRVIRRSSLPMLYPLPDRLHFTPSMSARALTNGLRVIEIPMRYEERVGESKLRVLSDGFQFLRTIIEGVLCYRPERLFLMVFVLFMLVSVLLAMYPMEFYLHNRRVEEWMIYRFLTCFLLGSVGYLPAGRGSPLEPDGVPGA